MSLIHAVEHHFVVFLGRGTVTPAELRSRLAAALATARHADRPLLLFDLRDVALLDLAAEDLEELCGIVDRAGPAAKGARFAFVAEAEPVARTVQLFAAHAAALPIETKLFREIGEARAWLAYAELTV
jgi:hypothetical protein